MKFAHHGTRMKEETILAIERNGIFAMRRGRKKAADDTSKIDIGIIVRLGVPRQASVWSSDTGRQDLSAP